MLRRFGAAMILAMVGWGSLFAQKNNLLLAGTMPASQSKTGFFKVYSKDGKYYFDIPDSMLGRDIVVVSRLVKANTGSGSYAGDLLGPQRVIRFDKGAGNKINLYKINYALQPVDSSSEIFAAFEKSNQLVPAASFDTKTNDGNNKSNIIDVTEQIMGGGVFCDGAATAVTSIKAFASNIEIRALRSGGGDGAGAMETNTSLLLLPKTPMQPRYFDERVGYFNTSYTSYTANGIKETKLILRRRLEPKDGDWDKYKKGILVEPKKPIIIYIDPATPKKWIPYFIAGVNDWQAVLEKAGFKNAIMGKEAPTPLEDSTWSLEDAAHSAIVYKASNLEAANGPNVYDPRSGEMMESHISWNHNIIKLIHDTYFTQASPNDPRARKIEFDDSLTGQLIRIISSHEVGHALGLLHNLGASSTTPVEKLRDKKWLAANGHTASLMDYARFNYVAQPEDSVGIQGIFPRIGDYDRWAIEWGYRLFPQYKTAEAERSHLNKWVREKLTNHRLWYGNGEGGNPPDPHSQAEDLGDNAMLAGTYGIKNLQRVMANLLDWTKVDNSNYSNLTDMYHEIIGTTPNGAPYGQYPTYVGHVLTNLLGIYKTARTVEDNAPVISYVPKEVQQQAVAFLNKELFATPYWLLDAEILNRVGENPLTIIGGFQKIILNKIFTNGLTTIYRTQAAVGPSAYKPSEVLADLKAGVFTELESNIPIDIYRRNLQRNYVKELVTAAGNTNDPSDLPCVAKAQLFYLKTEIDAALPKVTDEATRQHLKEILHNLNAAL